MNNNEIKRVGFFKLGKAIKFNDAAWSTIGGDCEPKQLICAIAKLNPNVQYWLLSPNDLAKFREKEKPKTRSIFDDSKYEPTVPENIHEFHSKLSDRTAIDETVDIISKLNLDFIFFYTGPTSTVNLENHIMKVDGTGFVKSLDVFKFYAAPIITALNLIKKTPILGLLVDNRYTLSAKDYALHNRPTYYLAQNNFELDEQYYSNPPERTLSSFKSKFVYSGIETVFLLDKKRYDVDYLFKMKVDNSFIMLQNQGKGSGGGMDRWEPVKEYIVDNGILCDIYGKWDPEIAEKYKDWFKGEVRIESLTDRLLKTKYTFCVPIKSGMVTSKYAEMLHYGIIPFLHPSYDTQYNVFPENHFIRCSSPAELQKKIKFLEDNPDLYKKLFYSLQEKYIKDSYYTGDFINNKIWEAYKIITQ